MKAVAPPHSPPVENPCSRRASNSRTGAITPIDEYVGNTPISTVPTAINRMVSTSAGLRPRRSPMRPITTPPDGRNTRPTPKIRKVFSNDVRGSSFGKKFSASEPARNPNTPKSYHSMTLPMVAAKMARRLCSAVGRTAARPDAETDAETDMDHPVLLAASKHAPGGTGSRVYSGLPRGADGTRARHRATAISCAS